MGRRVTVPAPASPAAIRREGQPVLGVVGNISFDEATYSDGTTHRFLGGAALHVALAATARGLVAAPIAVVGHDLSALLPTLRARGVRTEALRCVDEPSCRFRILYTVDGDVAEVHSSFGAAYRLTEHALTQLHRYGQYHVCCRRPLDFARIVDALHGRPYSVDVYSPNPETLAGMPASLFHAASTVFTNRREFALLDNHADLRSCARVVVTDGSRPARVLSYGTEVAVATPPSVDAVEVTGAGDTAAGSFLAAVSRGLTDESALQMAMADAADAVQRVGLNG